MSGNLSPTEAAITEAMLSALADPTTAARFLSAIAERTGAVVFRSAAGMLRRGNVGGRPRRDDAAAITRMATMLTDGTANSPEQAARFVARTLIGEVSTDAAAARLARKYRSADKT